MVSLRKTLIEKLNTLDDEQIAAVLHIVNVIQPAPTQEDAYDESQDPAIGLFSSSPDLASQTKTILRDELGRKKHSNENQ